MAGWPLGLSASASTFKFKLQNRAIRFPHVFYGHIDSRSRIDPRDNLPGTLSASCLHTPDDSKASKSKSPPKARSKSVHRRSELHGLRLVCRLFKLAVDPFLFSAIHFDFQSRQSLLEHQVFTLIDSTTSPSRYCREIHIKKRLPNFELASSRAYHEGPIHGPGALKVHIISAIKSFQNLRVVNWHIINATVIGTIVDALTQLPRLEELHLDTHQFYNLEASSISSLKRLSHFRRISLVYDWTRKGGEFAQVLNEVVRKSPLTTHLDFSGFSSRDADLRECLFHTLVQNVPKETPLQLQHLRFCGCRLKFDNSTLFHLKFLSSIDMSCLVDSKYDHLWPAFGAATTWLKEISVDQCSQSLLDYLTLYSGLTKFCLIGHFGLDMQTRREVDQLYNVSLSTHKDTLSTLEICTILPGLLCITPTDMISILVLKELKSLSLTLALDPIESNDSYIGLNNANHILFMAFNFPRLQDLRFHFSRRNLNVAREIHSITAHDKIAKMILSADVSHLDASWRHFHLKALGVVLGQTGTFRGRLFDWVWMDPGLCDVTRVCTQ